MSLTESLAADARSNDEAGVLATVASLVRQVIGEDWADDTTITMETSFSGDLELESIVTTPNTVVPDAAGLTVTVFPVKSPAVNSTAETSSVPTPGLLFEISTRTASIPPRKHRGETA